MSRHHPLLAVMLVAVRVTATHHTVPHLTVVRVRQLSSLVLQFIEPLTGIEGPSNLRVWGQFALQCGVTLLLFVRLSQIGVFVESKGVMEIWFQLL